MAGEEEKWPQWPKDAKPQRIVDVQVGCGADELFSLLWAPKSPYVAQSQERIGNRDYAESWWAPEAELVAGGQGSAPKKPLKPAEYKGLSRRTSCSGSGMGLKYVNTEVQRCLRAAEGGPFEVDVIVHTTATYGDRFRPILRHRVAAAGAGKCCYTVDYTLVYISSTNSLLKRAIERGAYSGVVKNFEALVEVLSKFESVQKASKVLQAQGAAESQPAAAAQGQAAASAPAGASVLPWWAPALSPEGVRLMERPAAWLKSATGLGGAGSARGGRLATALACAALLMVLASLLFLLQASHAFCAASQGAAGRVCAAALEALDVPASLRQALTAAFLLAAANAVTAAAAAWLATRLPAAAGAVRRSSGSLEAGDQPAAGIRFEGFEQSLQSAATVIARGEGELERAAGGGGSGRDGGDGGGRRKQLLSNPLRYVGLGGIMGSKEGARAAGGPGSDAGAGAAGGSPSRAAANGGPLRSLTLPASATGLAQLLSDDEEGSLAGAGSAKASSTFRDLMNPAGLLDKTEVMFAQWSGANKAPKLEQEAAQAREVAVASSAMELANMGEPEEGVGPVEEEVFENERYQPFRGWGHKWPGHFLPTDRVGHWSTATSPLTPALYSASFDEITPRLCAGWDWVEESWRVDMRGLVENGVDEDGWAYAIDFGWMQWPPLPGSGRFKRVRDYVRRRRWVRSRVFTGKPGAGDPPLSPPRSEFAGLEPEASALSAPTLHRSGSGALDEAARPGSRKVSAEAAGGGDGAAPLLPASRKGGSLDANLLEGGAAVHSSRVQEAGKRAEPPSSDSRALPLPPPSRVLSPTAAAAAAAGRGSGESFSRFTDKMSSMFAAASSSLRDKAGAGSAAASCQGSVDSRAGGGGRQQPAARQGSLDGAASSGPQGPPSGGAAAPRQPHAASAAQAGPPVLERATAPPTEHPASARQPQQPEIATAGSGSASGLSGDLAAYFGIRAEEPASRAQPSPPTGAAAPAAADSPAAGVRLLLSCEGEGVRVSLRAETQAGEPPAVRATLRPQEAAAAPAAEAGAAQRGLSAAVDPKGSQQLQQAAAAAAAAQPKGIPLPGSGQEAAAGERGGKGGGSSGSQPAGSQQTGKASGSSSISSPPAAGRGAGWASEALGMFRQATGAMDDLQREWQGKISSSFKPSAAAPEAGKSAEAAKRAGAGGD